MIPLLLLAVFIGLAARNKPQRGPVAEAVCQVLSSPEVMNPGFGLMEAVAPIAYPDARWPQSSRWTTDELAELDELDAATLEEARAQVQALLRSAAFLQTCATAESDYAKAIVKPASPAGFNVRVAYGPRVEVMSDGKRSKPTQETIGPIPDVGAAVRVAELAAYALGTPPEEDAAFDRGVLFDDAGQTWDGLSGWKTANGYVTKLWSAQPMRVKRNEWDGPAGFETALSAALEGE